MVTTIKAPWMLDENGGFLDTPRGETTLSHILEEPKAWILRKGDGDLYGEAQIKESQEATLARFLNGLNREIQDIVELHQLHYSTLEDLVHQATKVKSQLKRKLSSRKSYPNTSWKSKEREKERPRRG
ncbi:hypothetical protein CR513_41858, partial [Mucuna pruriens]